MYFMFQQNMFSTNIMLDDSWLKLRAAPKLSSNRNYFSHLKKAYPDCLNIISLLCYFITCFLCKNLFLDAHAYSFN